jgi:hypothetical protein
MKKLSREPAKLESLNLFSLLEGKDGSTLYDPARRQSFLSQVDSGLAKALGSESTLHGIRAQSMFAGMVANLGAVKLLKQEDAGECYYNGDSIAVPDFRIVTASDKPILVEAKNHFAKKPLKPFRIRKTDLEELERYASATKTPLRFAIYWAPWNLWTLNASRFLTPSGDYQELSLETAMRENEMAVLGDFSIGTGFPLVLRLSAAENKQRSFSPDGKVVMSIGQAEISCAGVPITSAKERNVAFYLMMYSKWEYDGGKIELDDQGLPTAMVHTVSPPEDEEESIEHFRIIGYLSSLYSSLYNTLTLKDGKVERLRVTDPVSLAPVIPLQWEGAELPLWRFVLQPKTQSDL